MKQITDGSPAPAAGQMVRGGFGSTEMTTMAETAAVAVAAQAKAAIEARYILAMRQPREWMEVRTRLLKECKRPGFAAVAMYAKPIGQDPKKWPRGMSIRFAEAALRCMTNVFPETQIIYESDDKRIVQVSVTDLEANLTYSSQVVIDKTVERKHVKEGVQVLGERKNSYGDTVYLVRATEDDLLNKQNALISKAMRTHALRLLPGDIMDECRTEVETVAASADKADPEAAKKKLVDAFADLGVSPTDIAAWLRHSLDRIQPAEVTMLRSIYSAIRDGEATWDAVMEDRGETGSAEQQTEMRTKLEADAKAKLAEMKAKEQAKPTEGQAPLTEEEMKAATEAADAKAEQKQEAPKPKLTFGGRAKS